MKNFSFVVLIRKPLNRSTQINISLSPKKEQTEKGFISPNSKKTLLQQRIDNFIGKNLGNTKNKNVTDNNFYSIFTSAELSNIVAISPIPLSGRILKDNFSSKHDILQQSSKLNILEFDLVYNEQYENEKIYLDNVKDRVATLFKGISSSLFFFGPSESGKSFYCRGNKEEQGLIDFAIRELLRKVENENKQNELNVYVSIFNIFEGRFTDLLQRNFLKKETSVEDLNEIEVISRNELFEIINMGIKRRKIIEEESSYNNDFSKRSHLVISLILKNKRNYLSQIDFVEIASSHYILGDSDDININSLEAISLRETIVNYNNNEILSCSSKLDSLLRNSKTTKRKMVYFNCVIPNEEVLFDSLQSLKFSNNLREIMKTNCINNIGKEKNILSKETCKEEENQYIRTEEDEENIPKNKSNVDTSYGRQFKEDKLINRTYISVENKKVENSRMQEIERSLVELNQKSKDITDNLEYLRKDKIEGKLLFNKEQSSPLFESLKNELALLKSDNIIFREEINNLNELNSHLESELIKQRNRNYELAADYERVFQENLSKDRELEKLSIEVYKHMKSCNDFNDLNNLRFQMDIKIKELEKENKTLASEKQRLEIELKLYLDKYNELSKKYEVETKELSFYKIKQSEDMNLLDTKVERMNRETENLQRENNNLRLNEEKLRLELNNAEKQRDLYRDKYNESKSKNSRMSSKLLDIETEFKEIVEEKERENQSRLIKRSEESQKKLEKYESKQKLIEEMQNRIHNFKTGFIQKRYFNKNNEKN